MDAQRDDLIERFGRSLGVKDSRFDRPRPPTFRRESSLQGQRLILMPGDEPVRSRGLVEKGGAIRNRRSCESLGGETPQARIESRCTNGGNRENVSRPGSASSERRFGEGVEEAVALGVRKEVRDNPEARGF